MGALYLSGSQRLIAERVHFCGTMTRAAVEPRQIFEAALQCRAVSFVLFHTHPSGDPAPSREDLAFTRRMADAAEVLCVALADHLIIGSSDRWTSLRRWGVQQDSQLLSQGRIFGWSDIDSLDRGSIVRPNGSGALWMLGALRGRLLAEPD